MKGSGFMKRVILIGVIIILGIIDVILVGKCSLNRWKERNYSIEEIESFPPSCHHIYINDFGASMTEMEYNNFELYMGEGAGMQNKSNTNLMKGNSVINNKDISNDAKISIEQLIEASKQISFVHSNNDREYTKDTLLCYALDELKIDDYKSASVFKVMWNYYIVELTTPCDDDYNVYFDSEGSTVAIERGE